MAIKKLSIKLECTICGGQASYSSNYDHWTVDHMALNDGWYLGKQQLDSDPKEQALRRNEVCPSCIKKAIKANKQITEETKMIDIPLNKALIVVEGECYACCFKEYDGKLKNQGRCRDLACEPHQREDGKNVFFKLVDYYPHEQGLFVDGKLQGENK